MYKGCRRTAKRAATVVLIAACLGQAVPHAAAGTPRRAQAASRQIAIVIDDFGNGMKGTEEMLNLPVKVTVAIMPFLPSTQRDAESAHAMGHDVIVHMPMEPVRGRASWLGPGAILASLTDDEIRRRTEAAIDDVPYAIGMNNHMGSRVTTDERVMRIVLQVCKERGLFFLDSRTSWRTVVPKVARKLGVPLLQNNVFLDDIHTDRHVSKQIASVVQELKKHPSCIAIGHVGQFGLITSGELKNAIPKLRAEATFVRLSELIPLSSRVHGTREQ